MKGEIREVVKGEKYFLRVFLGRDAKGKRSWHSEMFIGKKRLAEGRLSELVAKHGRGQLVKTPKLAFIDYIDQWLSGPVRDTISRRTISDYESVVERYVRPHKVARIKLASLKAEDLETLYKDMRDRPLSVSTVRHVHTVVKRALKQAARRGKVHQNVADLVEFPKARKKKIPRALNFEQAEKFLGAARRDRFFAMWMLAMDSGMRPEEYLALGWADLDFSTRVVTIERVLCWNRSGGGYYFDDPKTEQSRRTIELAPSTADALREHRKIQNEDKMRAGKNWKVIVHEKEPVHLMFSTHMGTPLLLSNLHRRHFKPLLKAANISKNFRVYDLRHTCATLLGVLGVRAKLIQERLGHSTIKTTLDLYSHVLKEEQAVAGGKFEEALFSRLGAGG